MYKVVVWALGLRFSPLLIGARCSAESRCHDETHARTVSVPSSSGHGVQRWVIAGYLEVPKKFQSPPHRGTVFSTAIRGRPKRRIVRFSPLLIGARCSAGSQASSRYRQQQFQSPPHRGTVFSMIAPTITRLNLSRFSPLLIGARCSARLAAF